MEVLSNDFNERFCFPTPVFGFAVGRTQVDDT